MEQDSKSLNSVLGDLIDGKPETEVAQMLPALFKENAVAPSDVKAKAQNRISDTIKVGEEVLKNLAKLTEETKHPAAFKEFSTLFKNLVDANAKLIDSERADVKQPDTNDDGSPKTVHNHLHLPATEEGMETTADLLARVRGRR